jgi:hypothetical protein
LCWLGITGDNPNQTHQSDAQNPAGWKNFHQDRLGKYKPAKLAAQD